MKEPAPWPTPIAKLAQDIAFAIDHHEPRRGRLRVFEEIIAASGAFQHVSDPSVILLHVSNENNRHNKLMLEYVAAREAALTEQIAVGPSPDSQERQGFSEHSQATWFKRVQELEADLTAVRAQLEEERKTWKGIEVALVENLNTNEKHIGDLEAALTDLRAGMALSSQAQEPK
jgi:DNA repair exonuclease SbcCD ATPase subunit